MKDERPFIHPIHTSILHACMIKLGYSRTHIHVIAPPSFISWQITDTLKAFGPVNAVRMIRNKQTGEPRGFAFVDFLSVEDATNLMAYQNKTLVIDGRTVQLDYSTTPAPPSSGGGPGGGGSGGGGGPSGGFKDWICPQCSATNFARRNACYQCTAQKPSNPTLVPHQEDAPSCSLIVKGLSANSTEESVCCCRRALLDLASVPSSLTRHY